ncbi:helix-turn-helix transcriptional regulator [uncultured Microbulbifer sp.]|uniref:helix-turn-helix domain-containing protein n=1 Tax=uncultured Microbulbifer sp. TaxID=348147 RepID=UPI00260F95CD|nr:helix-turn-helix transcriptional regulator [uncultured Microbulbifer sp.]
MEALAEKPGERLRIVRDALGFTQKEFSDALGLKSYQIRNIEYGRHRVTEEVFAAFGKAMPELLPWIAFGGTISVEQLRQSTGELSKLLVVRINIGLTPDAAFLEPNNGDQQT